MVPASPRPRCASALVALLALLLAAGPLLLQARPAHAAAPFTVTTAGDNPDAALADGRCDTTLATTSAPCSLRAAIEQANASPGRDTIAFDIPGTDVRVIQPASPLPPITRPVTIDGYTQPGSHANTAATGTDAVLRIELDGIRTGVTAGLWVRVGADNSLIRGLAVGRFNDGIELEAAGVRVEGCFVGTNAAGTRPRGNRHGLFVVGADAALGDGPRPARNLISGNEVAGILLTASAAGARVRGNLIGTDRGGAHALGNGGGVRSSAAGAVIGSDLAGAGNVIAFNAEAGVLVNSPGAGNRILGNSIFANGGLGIDLAGDGATANDAGDADAGPNTLQNFPVITKATSTAVRGRLNSTPDRDFAVRLFANPGAQNEGKVVAARPLVVTTNANGDASFAFTLTQPIPAGRTVTATATNQGGSTSEFSAAVPVLPD